MKRKVITQSLKDYISTKSFIHRFNLQTNLQVLIMGEICREINRTDIGIAPLSHFAMSVFYDKLAGQISCLTQSTYKDAVVLIDATAGEMTVEIIVEKGGQLIIDYFYVKF